MILRALFAACLVLFAPPLRAADLAPPLGQLTADAVKEDGVTGIVLGVGLNGEAPAIATAGLANVDQKTPMTPEIGWKVASIAKTFFAALALDLEQEGWLSLDDQLRRFLPDVPNSGRVTLRQLLDHTSGYDDYISDAFVAAAHEEPGRVWSPRELLVYAQPQRQRFAPGSRYDYSNTNYLLLGMALNAAVGQPPAKEIRRRFLEPLGLTHTWFAAEEPLPRGALARGYADLDDSGVKRDATAEPWPLGGAEGAMVSNAADLIAWSRALFEGRVLSPKRLAEMLTFVTPPEEEGVPGSGYGLGVERLRIDGVMFYGHTGSAPGYNSAMIYDPATRTAIVVALNEDPADEALLDILLERVVHALEGAGAVRFPRPVEANPSSPTPAPARAP